MNMYDTVREGSATTNPVRDGANRFYARYGGQTMTVGEARGLLSYEMVSAGAEQNIAEMVAQCCILGRSKDFHTVKPQRTAPTVTMILRKMVEKKMVEPVEVQNG